jgi:hypothetical protein
MLRTVAEDFGHPYDPIVHADIDDMAARYRFAPAVGDVLADLVTEGRTARARLTGRVAGVRSPGLMCHETYQRWTAGVDGS